MAVADDQNSGFQMADSATKIQNPAPLK